MPPLLVSTWCTQAQGAARVCIRRVVCGMQQSSLTQTTKILPSPVSWIVALKSEKLNARTHHFSFASLYGRRGYRTLNPRRKSSESTWNRVVWLMPWLKVSNKNNCAVDYYTPCFTPPLHLPLTPSSVHVPSPYVYRPLRSLLRLACFCWRVSAFFLSVFCSLPPANQSFLYPSSLSPGHWNWKCNPVGWRPMITIAASYLSAVSSC